MIIYLNENNDSYLSTKESEIFIDKSGLIKYTNKVLGKEGRFICNSRPRRFGKSTAANMLSAYYSKGSDSKELFSDLDIAKDTSFETYLN